VCYCTEGLTLEQLKKQLREEQQKELDQVEPGQRKQWLTALLLEQKAKAKPPKPGTTAARTFLRKGR
jgi:hypothetical protein